MRTPLTLCLIASSFAPACGGGSPSVGAGGTGGHGASSGPASSSNSSGGGGTAAAGVPFVYVGGEDNRIRVFLLDRETGALEPRSTVEAGSNPSFLATDAGHRFLYAVNENSGQVASFAIDAATGELTFLNRVSSQGDGPAYVSVDRTGRWVLVANYGGGTAAVLPVLPNGSLGEAVDVESPGVNPHLIRTDASNRFAFVPNKGSDTVSQFLFDEATGRLEPSSPPRVDTAAGAGPRHLDFHPTAPYAFVINELGDTVVTYAFDAASGTLSPRQTVPTLPDSFDASQNFCADLHVSVDGRFLYGSNRGHDSLVIYSIDAATGTLTLVGHQSTGGQWPRNFGLDPAGGLLLAANQRSGTVVTFRIDAATGKLTQLITTQVGANPAWVGVIEQPAAP
jgi:6-phosphogluconolactonase